MKIRFINTYEPVTSIYRDLIPALTSKSVEVEIIISKTNYRERGSLSDYFKKNPLVHIKKITGINNRKFQGNKTKFVTMILYALHTLIYTLLGPDVDKNVFFTQPPFFSIWGYFLKIVRKQSYSIVLMDIQPEMSVALGLVNENSLIVKITRKLSKLALQNANGVVVIGRCMLEKLENLGVQKEKITVISNWADEQLVFPISINENKLRKDMGWQKKFVVLYAGNIGLPQYFEDLLSVAEKLSGNKNIQFVFIGEGRQKIKIKEIVNNKNLSNVQLLPFLHLQYSLAEIMSSADLHFVSLKEKCTGLAVPSKAYTIFASGRPLIFQGSKKCEIALILEEHNNGITVPMGDVNSLQSAIENLFENKNLRDSMGSKSRWLATNLLSQKVAIKNYVDFLIGSRISESG